ncbi:MAG: DUF4198 domain-containing protein [Chthoniobacterales bacterium]|nr:DUF4198 domain-containing protein [Chthoniobacterales bacterium]MDQ3120382.1 DUF4198 domain-containing protein [Verrucomicrobiota bacterium]
MITKQNAGLLIVSVLAAFVPSVARSHDTWLLPDRFHVEQLESATLNLTSSMAFPEFETGPKRERVESATYRLAGQTFDVTDLSAREKSLVIKTTPAQAGVATYSIKLPAKAIELEAALVEEYLDEVDASSEIRKLWKEAKEPKRWRELYAKHMKTFVLVGEPPADPSWAEPIGTGLEIVPEKDPTALREGDEFPVRVLKDGAPHADFSLNALAAGEKKGETRKTDAAGRVVFPVNKAGGWLLRGIDLRKSTRSEADWESDFVTLTFEVKAKP